MKPNWRLNFLGQWSRRRCETCKQLPEAHTEEGKCLFGPGHYAQTARLDRSVFPPRLSCNFCGVLYVNITYDPPPRCPDCDVPWILYITDEKGSRPA